MCGIVGILNDDARHPASMNVLARMLARIVHRGPDDEGRLLDGELAMGMRRLSIIDPDGGRQPISDESGRYTVVFNGEIYNYRELRADLQRRGHRFKTQCDTEVIVHLFEERGELCLDQLRGMYAFAIWDRRARSLFLARDRLGIKPLYYCQAAGSFVFASEIKALLQHPTLTAELDLQALSDYLSLKYVPAPRTMFQHVSSLPPGHWATIRAGSLDIRRYWDLSFRQREPVRSEDEYAHELTERLREAVRLRLRSDVPFGAFLSGGLDSSLLVALMSQEMSAPVKTFSVGFDAADGADELPYARDVARRFGCEHHEIAVDARDFVEQAESIIWHLDQPIADQATMATYMVAQLASHHVKMVLTGEGGDELFAGYARYVGERYAGWFRPLPEPVGSWIRGLLPLVPGMRRPKIALHALTLRDEAKRLAHWFPMFNDDLKCQLLSDELRPATDPAAATLASHLETCDARSPIDRMLYADTKLWLPDYLLLRGDKLTMANSLEARVPLLDHELVQFAASLPTDLKVRGRTRKYLLKRVARNILPETIVRRPKQGFPIPIDRWLRNEAREPLHDLLADDVVRRRGLFQPGFVHRLLAQHQTGFADHSTLIWGLMSLEIWMRRFIDDVGAPALEPDVSEQTSLETA